MATLRIVLWACGATVVATIIRLALVPYLGTGTVPFLFYFPAIVIVSWRARLVAGLLTLVLSCAAVAAASGMPQPGGIAAYALFILVTLLILGAMHAMHRSRDALQRSDERFRLAQQIAKFGTFYWDIRSKQSEWSDDFVELFGRKPQSVVSSFETWLSFLHPDDRDEAKARIEQALQTGTYVQDFRVVWPDGSIRWLHARAQVMRDSQGEPAYMMGIHLDITDRHEQQQQLEAARDQAIAANKTKDAFLAMLSHELRTPLSPVLITAVSRADDPHVADDVKRDFEMIARNIRLEARLIDDLLDISRITHGKLMLEKEDVEIHAVIADVIQILDPEIRDKALKVHLSLAAARSWVLGDRGRLLQVLWNILRNAVKFSVGHAEIMVATANVDGALQVSITDRGVGMTEQELARIFRPFSQGDNLLSAANGGMGLGLSICLSLVEMHGGTISAASAGPNQGATFEIILPDARPKPPEVAAPLPREAPAEPVGTPKRVLLVEDHADTRRALATLLKHRGCVVELAASVAEATELFTRNNYDVVLSDIGLPDGDGWTLVSALKKLKPQVRAVAMSGFGMDSDLQRSRQAGFDAHIIKPVQRTQLEKALGIESKPA
ncbi:MAG TPA: PAS domain-containing protein [Lacunisphaera sp.]|nr:PAS domain-containing protein [Lacunisphaera sp.]